MYSSAPSLFRLNTKVPPLGMITLYGSLLKAFLYSYFVILFGNVLTSFTLLEESYFISALISPHLQDVGIPNGFFSKIMVANNPLGNILILKESMLFVTFNMA